MLDGELFHFNRWRKTQRRPGAPPEEPAFQASGVEDGLGRERVFLARLGISKPLLDLIEMRARISGASLEEELLADGRVRPDAYFGALSKALGLEFATEIDPSQILDEPILDTQLSTPRALRCHQPNARPLTAIVPSIGRMLAEKARFDANPSLRRRFVGTLPTAVRKAVWSAGAQRRGRRAAFDLFDAQPDCSARIVFSGRQGLWLGLVIAGVAAALAVYPSMTLLAFHAGLSLSYFLLLLLRGFALQLAPPLNRRTRFAPRKGAMPVYTVLVPLYREQAVVGQLIERLDRLNWPRSRLDIKLLCEADDAGTIEALAALPLGAEYEVVLAPDIGPRTKPKALNYGLAGARGDYLVIYDAEDRPHADQLVEAWHHFRSAPENVVCFQSPLVIANATDSSFSALFALEYSALFRRLLPLLADYQLPLPLGGTSNHFKTEVLKAIGGWDPFNVTEDADLGMRLVRNGYVAEILTRPTVEDAPVTANVWIGQRSRWFKGWMQTWLVHMRYPLRLLRDLGPAGFLSFHMVISGLLLSALAHPLIIVFLALSAVHFFSAYHLTVTDQLFFLLDLVNVAGAYTVFTLMGWGAMSKDERKGMARAWRFIPIYWLMMSWAAWKGALELRTKPYFWNKTPHGASIRRRRGQAKA